MPPIGVDWPRLSTCLYTPEVAGYKTFLDLVGFCLPEVGSLDSFDLGLGFLELVQNFLELVLDWSRDIGYLIFQGLTC